MTPRPPLDELLALFRATVAAEGITTGAGTAAGDNFIDAALAGAGDNSFVSMLAILYPGQPLLVDSKDITAFNDGTGTVTLAGAYKGVAALIPAGVPYKIVTFRFVPAEVAALVALVVALTANTGDIFNLVNAILTTAETGDTITTTALEQDMYVNNTPAGVYKPLVLKINTTNMVANDGIVVRVYERISPTGDLEKQEEKQFNDVQDPVLKKIPLHPNRYGIQTTIQRVAGVDKAYVWEVVMDDSG